MRCNFVRLFIVSNKDSRVLQLGATHEAGSIVVFLALPTFLGASVLHAASKLCRVDLAHEVVRIAQQLPRRAETLRRPLGPAQNA